MRLVRCISLICCWSTIPHGGNLRSTPATYFNIPLGAVVLRIGSACWCDVEFIWYHKIFARFWNFVDSVIKFSWSLSHIQEPGQNWFRDQFVVIILCRSQPLYFYLQDWLQLVEVRFRSAVTRCHASSGSQQRCTPVCHSSWLSSLRYTQYRVCYSACCKA